jgi:hypothetical protein
MFSIFMEERRVWAPHQDKLLQIYCSEKAGCPTVILEGRHYIEAHPYHQGYPCSGSTTVILPETSHPFVVGREGVTLVRAGRAGPHTNFGLSGYAHW